MAGPLPHTVTATSVLVVRLSALGDVIRTLPLLPPLRHRFPQARLHWLSEPAARPVLEAQPLLDSVLDFPRGPLSTAIRGGRLGVLARLLAGVHRELRCHAFDVVIDAQGTYKSGVLTRLTGAPVRVGFARGAAREYLPGAATHTVYLPEAPISRVAKALRLLEPLAADPAGAAASLPENPAAAAEAATLWRAAGVGRRVLIAPGASLRQAFKIWPALRFGELAQELGKDGVAVRVAWGPGEEAMATEVCAAAGDERLRLPRTPLPLLAELLRQADLFVGNDSGPMHLAWLVGTRVVALYGPTDPVVNAPWGDGHVCLDGAPGGERRRDPVLMEQIEVDTALARVREVLGG